MRTIKELEQLIAGYQASYYNGEAEISDAEFDALWDELQRRSPENPLLKKVGPDALDSFQKARHLIPMGSQEKAANPEEYRSWALKTGLEAVLVQYKLDGASLELQYEEGLLVRAVTRGDGLTGDDITRNAIKMQGAVRDLGLDFSGGIRGEVIMTREIWRSKYSDKANCRNAANGLMRRKDGQGAEDLKLVCYDASATGNDDYFSSELEKIAWLQERGFYTTPTMSFSSIEDVISYRERVSLLRPELEYDIDGLVVKENETDMADLRKARPERQIAFKFELEEATSILREVIWSESGATYTPIGIVDPVRLGGTTVQRANLNNPAMIKELNLRIGSSVIVVKRGEIIPKIERLALVQGGEGEAISYPSHCSTCGTALSDLGTRLLCPNPECPKRIHHRIEKWISVLDIREFGDKLLRRLYENGRLQGIADLYSLTEEELLALDRMGELSARKVLNNIRKERSISLALFVAGFDFEGVGETILEKVVLRGFDSLEKLRSASVQDLASVPGLGEITSRAITEGFYRNKGDMDATLAAGIISIAPPVDPASLPLRGLSFCFTGELKTIKRNSAEERLKALGASVKNSVVKDLSYLVTNDVSSGSSKCQKALKLGIPILDEAAFNKLFEKQEKPGQMSLFEGALE
ncbi:NAD-dependent DNA ligase LigA [Treponema sp.]